MSEISFSLLRPVSGKMRWPLQMRGNRLRQWASPHWQLPHEFSVYLESTSLQKAVYNIVTHLKPERFKFVKKLISVLSLIRLCWIHPQHKAGNLRCGKFLLQSSQWWSPWHASQINHAPKRRPFQIWYHSQFRRPWIQFIAEPLLEWAINASQTNLTRLNSSHSAISIKSPDANSDFWSSDQVECVAGKDLYQAQKTTNCTACCGNIQSFQRNTGWSPKPNRMRVKINWWKSC